MAHLAAPRPDELTQPGTDAAPPSRWRPTVDGVAPTGLRTKVAANLRALETLRTIDNEARPATHDEQAILSRWSSWGALPAMFDSANEQWAELRSQLEQLLTPEQWSAARRTTLNAHYTQPGVIGPVWDFVRSLGFDGGRVLEPGCGSGHFIGFAPTEVDIDWTGVELDPTTARITQLLYPQADIRTEGFEQTALADGSVDLVVGNVPFGKIALHDPRHNRAGHSIHNHFIIKSLRLCRPGGLVAVLTSRYTLDSRNDRARSTIGELGDFVTAIRLPSSTHRAVAGTDAVTDLVVFQRRTPGTTPNHARDWQATTEIDTADGSVRVNTWFADHPDLMLGEVRLGGQYRGDDLRLIGDFDSDHLRRTLTEQAVSARSRGHIVTSRVEADQPVRSYTALPVDQKHLKPGSIVVLGNDAFGRLVDGRVEPIDVSKSSRAEVRALCGLRDVLAELLDVQTEALDDAEIASLQERLSHRYDRYVARYGALNRFTWARTGRTDDNGQEIMRRNRPRMGGFRDDPDAPNVFALEVFDADDQIATKSAVFNRRLLVPRAVQAGTDDPSEAVLISLDQLGRVDLDRIADLLDTDPTDARQRVGQLVYDDPSAGQIETAAAYLSGDVRTKLDAAREAAAVDDRFQVNVDALTAVLPVDLTADEIDIRPGQSWIPTDVVEQFVTEVLDTTSVTVAYDSVTATWEIDVPTWRRSSVTMTSEWGTERKDAVALLQSAANNSPVTVYDQLDDTRVINHQATLDAREKQAELVTRFAQWVWEDRDRANRLSTIYNERFNAHVARSYDGSHLTLPGLASSFEPRAHQRAAVARILAEPTALLAHEVGAGKTATMVIASMELRRLGLVNKPMVVVPNHMLEQFCTEWRALYPAAKVLFPTAAEQGPAGRKLFVARAAVGEWDAVVVTESVFERIPLAPATEARFIERQVGELREASTRFEATMGRRSRTVKDIELRALKLEQRHKNLLHRADKDDGATFEQLGVDYLFVDEAHHAKNLGISTRLQGLGKKGSGYAAQLDIRLDWLRERYGSKVLTLSTATPIANSLSEMWVMQHYARPDRLDAAGVGPFDAWASNFAAQVTRLELAPEGTHYRIATRLAKFRNVPDLIAMFTEFADVKTTADLDLPKPALVNGSAETVVVPSDDQLRSFVAGLGERAERVRNRSVQPDEDNMLKISSEGRAAALDVRLVGLHQPVGTTKLTTAVSDQGIPSSAIIENRHGVGASAGGW